MNRRLKTSLTLLAPACGAPLACADRRPGDEDPGESCDGKVEGVTCEDLGFEGGVLMCKD